MQCTDESNQSIDIKKYAEGCNFHYFFNKSYNAMEGIKAAKTQGVIVCGWIRGKKQNCERE